MSLPFAVKSYGALDNWSTMKVLLLATGMYGSQHLP